MTVRAESEVRSPELAGRVEELKERARRLRRELPDSAAAADAENADSAESMRKIWEAGLYEFHLPRRYGGITDGDPGVLTEDFLEIVLDLCAGDSAAGMNYSVQTLVTTEIFGTDNGLPESTKAELAELITRDGVRLVASNAETGSARPVLGRVVPGGIRISGVKSFNTNSGGGGWANVGLRMSPDDQPMSYHALVPLDSEGVRCTHEWDMMGQRGTHSQTIEYNDVFVPDGYHFPRPGMSPGALSALFLAHSAIMLGPGYGALDAALDYVRKLDRSTLPGEFDSATTDPLVRRRIGEYVSTLGAARAYLLRTAGQVAGGMDDLDLTIESFAVKVACVKAALDVTAGIFDLTGARSASNRYRFDRFWRNARTFSLHDPTDAKEVWVGDYHLTGAEPPVVAYLRV
ncbi:acyl-CoA dehydrogenase family protein [Nocardia macrotermitis]|uniref:Dibenzothiophene desulfurization enzyme C n=1 Tax=Nocardia macrotermitis TaxID=2585198 RepID=A0A7K0D416_9NOCA|nr:acyl-CoA dehydrogenase family protein [Nocardia macrotermitis]MQY20341.1 Dibenzothiophene desulfurization enzyme C [Nocardia macrotermitis]